MVLATPQFAVPSEALTADRPPPELTPDQRRRLHRLAAIPVLFALLIYAGNILSGALVSRAPLVLLVLNATDPFLLLIAHEASLVGFMAVGAFRLFAPDLFLYQIGLEYGANTRSFLDAELGPGNRITRAMDWMEAWFPRVGWLILFLAPGYPMCLLSGVAKMKRSFFIAINLAGTFTRLTLIWWVSSVFDGPVGAVVRFINRYSLPVTVVMIILVFVQANRAQNRRPPPGEAPEGDS